MQAIQRRSVGSIAVLAAALVVAFAFSAVGKAAPGDLDPTFSGDGKQTSNLGPGFSGAAAIVRQPDGKIVAVGANESSPLPPGLAFGLARYKPDGSLDPSFAGDGKQATEFGGRGGAYEGVALQPDGKIIAVGRTGGPNPEFALARYLPNGSLDPSFSGDGKQTTGFGGDGEANGVAIQADGKIVVVGNGGPDARGDVDFALARYNPNGSLDRSFSGDGKQTTDFGGNDFASGVAVQANGRIVAVGTGSDGAFALARYNPNGSLDPSFSGDGKRITDFHAIYGADGVALQANGKIVAVGDAANGDFALARYNPDGSLDPSFAGDGKQATDFGVSGYSTGANAVAIRTDGKIVAVGSAGNLFALARYNPNGSLDSKFSGDGRQTTDFGGLAAANGVALFGDGTIVAGGTVNLGDHSFFALARYNPNGSLDPSFSGDGRQTSGFGGPDAATGVAIQANGRIVAVGDAAGHGFGLARYTPNGSLDPSFSGDGKQTTDFGTVGGANGVALQADGKIVAVGSARYGFALARYNPNGSLDPSFAGDGVQTTGCFAGAGCSSEANALAIQANGRIVAVGIVDSGGGFALARFNANGSLDPSFAGDGMETNYLGRVANAVAIQPDGKIVVVGSADDSSSDFAVARYKPNGSLDPSFSGDGMQTTDFGGFDEANGVAIQADGKIVAVGNAGGDFGVARYNPNGSLDPSFSGDGMQTTDFGGADSANGVALQANGRIVAVGDADLGDHGAFALARYNANGSLDPSFSEDGKRATDFSSGGGANGVALDANGRIVAVGSALGTDLSSDFALARYLGQ